MLSGEEGDKLRKIEEKMFTDLVKKEVEKEVGEWRVSKQENNLADFKIVMNVKSSFRTYEKTKQSFEKIFFKFL